jgi:hypothetical protein
MSSTGGRTTKQYGLSRREREDMLAALRCAATVGNSPRVDCVPPLFTRPGSAQLADIYERLANMQNVERWLNTI